MQAGGVGRCLRRGNCCVEGLRSRKGKKVAEQGLQIGSLRPAAWARSSLDNNPVGRPLDRLKRTRGGFLYDANFPLLLRPAASVRVITCLCMGENTRNRVY